MNESREELITAYIDDELSAEDRARVETWLAENAELRQLHDELLALRAGLQALPKHTLEHDLAAAVLLRAQQSDSPAEEPTQADETKDASAVGNAAGTIIPHTAWWQRGSSWRRVVWPALAVAAALVVLVYDARQRPAEQEVAQAPEHEAASAGRPPAGAAELSAPGEASLDEPSTGQASESLAGRSKGPGFDIKPRSPEAPGNTPLYGSRGMPQLKDSNGDGQFAKSLPKLKQSLHAVDGEAPTFVYSVSPQYLESKAFAKLLDAEQIDWEKVTEPALAPPPATGRRRAPSDKGLSLGKSEAGEPLRATYLLRGSRQRINEVLGKLPLPPGQVHDTARAPRRGPLEKLPIDAAQSVRVTLIAPPDPATAVPAAPAAADR